MTQTRHSNVGGNTVRGSRRIIFSGCLKPWPRRAGGICVSGRCVSRERGPADFGHPSCPAIKRAMLGAWPRLGAQGTRPCRTGGRLCDHAGGCALPRSSDCDPAQSGGRVCGEAWGLARDLSGDAFGRADGGALRAFAMFLAQGKSLRPSCASKSASRKNIGQQIADGCQSSASVSGRDQDGRVVAGLVGQPR